MCTTAYLPQSYTARLANQPYAQGNPLQRVIYCWHLLPVWHLTSQRSHPVGAAASKVAVLKGGGPGKAGGRSSSSVCDALFRTDAKLDLAAMVTVVLFTTHVAMCRHGLQVRHGVQRTLVVMVVVVVVLAWQKL